MSGCTNGGVNFKAVIKAQLHGMRGLGRSSGFTPSFFLLR